MMSCTLCESNNRMTKYGSSSFSFNKELIELHVGEEKGKLNLKKIVFDEFIEWTHVWGDAFILDTK